MSGLLSTDDLEHAERNGHRPANERMQLTWLLGAPIRAGLGSPARLRAMRPRFSRHAADASR